MNSQDARALLVSIARTDVGQVEVTRNRAPWIKKLWPATSYPEGYNNREPYCAAGLCWVVKTWLERLATMGELRKTLAMGSREAEAWRCKSAGAWRWMQWAESKGLTLLSDKEPPRQGDIMVFDISHIGLVVRPLKGGLVETIEYNTNAGGSREGDGCWLKTRRQADAQKFIQLLG